VTSVEVVRESEIVPLFFGPGARQLFGVYHAPNGVSVRDAGVVLCYPAPQEYSQAHWAFQKLAGLLADAGLHVLRFDYSCTGDSWGESADGTLDTWTADIAAAVAQLREIAGIRRVALVGMRVGAALALRAVAAGLRIRDLVLWEPVIHGAAYLDQLESVEDRRLRLLHFPEPDTRVAGELLGYAFGATMRSATAAIDLTKEPVGSPDRVLIVTARETADQRALNTRLHAAGIHAQVQPLHDRELYVGGGHPNDALLSHAIPVAITAFLTRSDA
jgi:uncharacterized protein